MKQLLSGVALVAVLAIFVPAWAQAPANPSSTTAPPSASSPAPSSSAVAPGQTPAPSVRAPAAPEKATATAGNWAQPKPRRHARHVRRYARYGYYPYYGHPYYGYYRWGSPSDHIANQLNAQQLGGWGWGGPYSRSPYTSY